MHMLCKENKIHTKNTGEWKNSQETHNKKTQTVPYKPWGIKIYSSTVSGGESAGQYQVSDTGQQINTKPLAWITFINTGPRQDLLREWKSCIKFQL